MFKGSLSHLGWSDFFERQRERLDPSLVPGRVAVEHKIAYDVLCADGEVRARLPGKLRRRPRLERPAVGDWVALDTAGTIHKVFERRTSIVRLAAGERAEPQVIAANCDIVFVVTAIGGDLNPRRLERYLTAVRDGGATAVIVVNKADLEADRAAITAQLAFLGAEVLFTAALTGEGTAELGARVPAGTTAALVGSSGVGKSTLVNVLLGAEVMATNEVRASDERGKHTTTQRHLLPLPGGGLLLDTPGMRELKLWAEEGSTLEDTFEDILSLATGCRFSDCRHATEGQCAVRAALASGQLDPARWASYQKLDKERTARRPHSKR